MYDIFDGNKIKITYSERLTFSSLLYYHIKPTLIWNRYLFTRCKFMQSVDIDIEHWRAVDGMKHNAQLRQPVSAVRVVTVSNYMWLWLMNPRSIGN